MMIMPARRVHGNHAQLVSQILLDCSLLEYIIYNVVNVNFNLDYVLNFVCMSKIFCSLICNFTEAIRVGLICFNLFLSYGIFTNS